MNTQTPSDCIELIKKNNIAFIDIQFGDLYGRVHHFTVPANQFSEESFESGLPFDGSSIRSWQGIEKSDMLIVPDPSSMFVDPFREMPTICFFGNIVDPRTHKKYEKDPRSVLFNALEYMKSLGIGDTVFCGPEPEFFIFDSVRYTSERNMSFYQIESNEGPWTSIDEGGLGNKIDFKGGYFPVSPTDTLMDIRNEIAHHITDMGLVCEVHHHEVATAGQCEIDFKFDNAIQSCDNVYKLKYAVKNTAHKYGKTATFMPKPIFEDNGSGMHIHISIWNKGKNTFYGDEYASMSKQAMHAIGGILKHGRSIQLFTNPSCNSYRRLVPGYEAPVRLAYSSINRSATIRIPYSTGEKSKRFEFRCPDSSGSPHLAVAAIIMACIDGITNQIDPGDPMDKNIYDLPPEELNTLESTSESLEHAIHEFEKDNEWIKKGSVFTDTLISSYIEHKMVNEIEPLKLRPNPHEFNLYYNL